MPELPGIITAIQSKAAPIQYQDLWRDTLYCSVVTLQISEEGLCDALPCFFGACLLEKEEQGKKESGTAFKNKKAKPPVFFICE